MDNVISSEMLQLCHLLVRYIKINISLNTIVITALSLKMM